MKYTDEKQYDLCSPVVCGDGGHDRIAASTLLDIHAPALVSQYHMAILTNETFQSWGTFYNSWVQWAMVYLPHEDCYGCTIRLFRQVRRMGCPYLCHHKPYIRINRIVMCKLCRK